jgi:cytochrome c-type biogenesis protein CcmH
MSWLAALIAVTLAPLTDPAQEARAQALEREIRCVQCENEPISQSTADIAGDMRALVRERISAGDSDTEIRSYFRDRYGSFVLLRPPMEPTTWLLWAAPIALALLVLALAVLALMRRRNEQFEPEEGER